MRYYLTPLLHFERFIVAIFWDEAVLLFKIIFESSSDKVTIVEFLISYLESFREIITTAACALAILVLKGIAPFLDALTKLSPTDRQKPNPSQER